MSETYRHAKTFWWFSSVLVTHLAKKPLSHLLDSLAATRLIIGYQKKSAENLGKPGSCYFRVITAYIPCCHLCLCFLLCTIQLC